MEELPTACFRVTTEQKNLTAVETTTWQWARAARASGPWRDIWEERVVDSHDSVMVGREKSYTPSEDDAGMYLRATATYEDGHCAPCDTKKTAQAVSANSVQAEPYTNSAPEFDEESFDEDPGTADVQTRTWRRTRRLGRPWGRR